VLTLLGCYSSEERSSTTDVVPAVAQPYEKASPEIKSYKDGYTLQDLGLNATLAVTAVGDSLDFRVVIIDEQTSKSDTIIGVAVDATPGADSELDEDETGTMFPAEEYSFNNNGCEMSVRISSDPSTHLAKINVVSCKSNPLLTKISGILLK
jgi:hypothetical protein